MISFKLMRQEWTWPKIKFRFEKILKADPHQQEKYILKEITW